MRKKSLIAATLAFVMIFSVGCDGNKTIGPSTVSEGSQNEDNKTEEVKEINNAPVFSLNSGFYEEAVKLEMSCEAADAKIYYTLDGSKPTESSIIYDGNAIELRDKSKYANVLSLQGNVNPDKDYFPKGRVTKCNVVRAVAVLPNGEKYYSNGTYFVGVDRESEYEKLPIISMFTDVDNLFDYEKGIYVMGKSYDEWIKENPSNQYKDGWQKFGNFSQKGKEWEREALIEYLPADGSDSFSQDVGIRIMGAASRSSMQKSFRITAREEYGKKSLKYGIIPGNIRGDGSGEVTKYKSFLLRNGGNDNEFAKIRDPYLQYLVKDRIFDTQQSTPAFLFLDGEFWGMYTITEDYSSHYVQNNYGIDDNEVVMIKRGEIEDGEDEDIKLYYDMFDFICYNDMSNADNYKKAGEMLDLQNFAEYLSFMLYIYNQDSFFESNNWAMWRSRTVIADNPYADGKWRMMAYDTEYSTDIYGDGSGYRTNNVKGQVNGTVKSSGDNRRPKDLMRSLLKNDEFKKLMVNTLCDMRNIDFEQSRAVAELDRFVKLYRNGAVKTYSRFGPDWVTYNPDKHFTDRTNVLRTFMKGRYANFINIVKDSFSLGNAGTLSISKYDVNKGVVRINNTELNSESFKGNYFSEFEVTVTAKAINNATFKGIKVDGKLYTGDTVSIKVGSNTTVEVLFE